MSKKLRYDGKVVVVTGAGAGLGRSYALAFAERGAKVVVNDLGGDIKGEGKSARAADHVVNEIRAKGGEAVANYNSVEDGEKVIQTALDNYGRVDILINNAGILRDRSFARTSDLDWDLIHRVHLRASFLVTRAAWEHMKKNNYGRIIMTTSSAGLYGNFGQSNYSAAKMGLVGLSNTLSKEGKKYNIFCNTIAPMAGSRLTQTVMPQDMVDALKPEYMAPIVLWLCHEDCTNNGDIFEGGAGYVAQVQLMKSKGVVIKNINVEAVRDNWEKICDFSSDYTTPKSTGESSGSIYVALQQQNQEGIKSNPTAAVTPEAAIGHVLPEGTYSYTQRDTILYALGIGQSTQHPGFLKYLFELRDDFGVMPTYGAVIGQSGMGGLFTGNLPVNINPTQILHGEQYLELFKPLPSDGKFTNKAKVVDVMDKGKGAVFVVDVDTFDENGDKIMRGQSCVYVQGMGNYGGKRKSTALVQPQDPPSRPPDASIKEKTSVDQAALYRLSGDYNPLHIDPEFAAMGGFDTPILHGLCSFGYSGRHVLQQYCDNDPSKFKAIKVRFSRPVLPGQTLQTDMWKEGSRVHFQTKVIESGNVCLTGAYVDIVESGSPDKGVSAEPQGEGLLTDLMFLEIQNRVETRPDLLKKVNAVMVWNITKDGKTKTWTVDLKNAPGSVYNGPPKKGKANVTITASDSDLIDIAAGKLNPQQAFFQGKLKATGNIMLGMKLEGLFKEELSKL